MTFEGTMRETKMTTMMSEKVCKAQLAVYAGIYNRDYGLYKKGVDAFAKYGRRLLLESRDPTDGMLTLVATDDPSIYAGSPDVMEQFYQRKVSYYAGLYGELPRGYFQ